MKQKLIIVLGLVACLAVTVVAQKPGPPKLEPTPATESQAQLLREGVALHDKGDYAGAVKN